MGATDSLFASPSHEEQPHLQFLPSPAAAAAVPKASGEKAGSELEKQARSLPLCQAEALVLQTKPKQTQPKATGGKQH